MRDFFVMTAASSLIILGVFTTVGASRGGTAFPAVSELPARPDLPDPLVMFNGERVTTKEQWVETAPAGAEGTVPALHVRHAAAAPEKVTATVEREDPRASRRQGDAEGSDHRLRPAGHAEDPPAPRRPQRPHGAGPGLRRA